MSLTSITFDHVLVSVLVAHVRELLDISSGDRGSSPTWHTLPWNYLTHSHLGPPDTLSPGIQVGVQHFCQSKGVTFIKTSPPPGVWAVEDLFWSHRFDSYGGGSYGNDSLLIGSILSHMHFEWLSVRMDGCEWVHSFTVIHSPRQSFPLTHSFPMTVCVNRCLRINWFTDTSIHTDSHSHSSNHQRVILTKPPIAGIEPVSPEQILNSSITCATETPT